MTNDLLHKAIDATKGLTTDDLGRLRSHITALLSFGRDGPDCALTASNHDDWVLMGIADFIRDAGMPQVGVKDMMRQAQYQTFKRKRPHIENYLSRVGQKNAQRALLRVGLGLMKLDLHEQRVPISYVTLMNDIHRLPGLINREFPGYLESGLLPLIIRGETNDRKMRRKL